MSLALCPEFQAVLFSSETQGVLLSLLAGSGRGRGASSPNGWRRGHCTHRIDMDEGGGEVMQLVLRRTSPAQPTCSASSAGAAAPADGAADGWALTPEHPAGGFLRLRVYSLRRGSEVEGLSAFAAQGRLVDLRRSPYVSFPATDLGTPGRDAVAADLADIPRVRCLLACLPACVH